mmetsp:Transcript_84802/g.168404  ORF Transcript_84802/g.168404 Transcript_84802/m.168404 type:complete len:215 (+) Transcript_84802:215-859(+)
MVGIACSVGKKPHKNLRSACASDFLAICCFKAKQEYGRVTSAGFPSLSCTLTNSCTNCLVMSFNAAFNCAASNTGMPVRQHLLPRLTINIARKSSCGISIGCRSSPRKRHAFVLTRFQGIVGKLICGIGTQVPPRLRLPPRLPCGEASLRSLSKPSSSSESASSGCELRRHAQKPKICDARARARAWTAFGSERGKCKTIRSISVRLIGPVPTR